MASITGVRARPTLLIAGIVSALIGLAALVWPAATLATISLLFGIALVLVGGLRLFVAVRGHALPTALRWFVGVLGALVLVAGVLTIANPFGQLTVLAYVIGIAWIIDGIAGLFGGLPDAASVPRGLAVSTCVLSIAAGILVLVLPGVAIATFLAVGAAFLIVTGLLLVAVWLLSRR